MSVGSPKSLSPSSPVSPESASPVPQCGCDDQAPAAVWVKMAGFTNGTECFMCESLNGLFQCDYDRTETDIDYVCCVYDYHYLEPVTGNEVLIEVYICKYTIPSTVYSIEVHLIIEWDSCPNLAGKEIIWYDSQAGPYDCDNLEETLPLDNPGAIDDEDCQPGTCTVYGPNTAPI